MSISRRHSADLNAALQSHLQANRKFKAEKLAHIFSIPVVKIAAPTATSTGQSRPFSSSESKPKPPVTPAIETPVLTELKRVTGVEPGLVRQLASEKKTISPPPQSPFHDDHDYSTVTRQLFDADTLFDRSEPCRDALLKDLNY